MTLQFELTNSEFKAHWIINCTDYGSLRGEIVQDEQLVDFLSIPSATSSAYV